MSLIKKVGSVVYGGYKLITNFSCILVILAPHLVDDAKALEPLTIMHIKKTSIQDFTINIEVLWHFNFSFLHMSLNHVALNLQSFVGCMLWGC